MKFPLILVVNGLMYVFSRRKFKRIKCTTLALLAHTFCPKEVKLGRQFLVQS